MGADSAEYAKLVARPKEKATLEIFALDPGLATRACLDFAATIHMSGTLRPLDQYRDAIGLPRDTKMATMPSPFDPENLEVVVADDVTTRWESLQRDAALADRLHDPVVTLANATRRNTAIFYPSYAMLRGALDAGLRQEITRRVLVDDRELSRAELASLLDAFKAAGRDGGAVLLSVMGGRVSEGIDFPAEQLEVAVLVGLPYARPSAKQRALVNYYDLKFGRGWEYAAEAPMLRKVVQSIGRLIRTPTDRALAVLLDNRALKFRGRLPTARQVSGESLGGAVLEWSNRVENAASEGAAAPHRKESF
jgi:DNA excision repair protein ERCC-2